MLRRSLGLAFLAVWIAAACRGAEPGPVVFGRAEITVEGHGRAHRFSVEVATTPEQRARGLMEREVLSADRGMLFILPEKRVVCMWMKDTLIPLDMLFLGPGGQILKIAGMTEPNSTAIISSGVPVHGVLELAGGAVARLGIRDGDRVVHPAFAP